MRALLARLTPNKAIGVYVDETEVVLSYVAGTPLGVVELECQRQPYAPRDLVEVISGMLRPLLGSKKRQPKVGLGISARRVFYSTRPLKPDNNNATPQALLRNVLLSPNVSIDEMSAEMTKGEFNRRKFASVASCRKEYLYELLEAFAQCGVQPFRTEPAPMALLRAGALRRRARRSKPVMRVFFGDREALAVVTAGNLCIFWKSFKLPESGCAAAVSVAIRSCQGMLRQCGIETALDAVIMHGRPDLRPELTNETFVQKAGVAVVWCDEPPLGGPAIAYGLAVGCLLEQRGESLDLTKSLTPDPCLSQIFPWGEMAVQLALVMCMGLFMWERAHNAQRGLAPVQAELGAHSWVGKKKQAELVKEKQDLTTRVDAVRKFVTTRVLWTNYTHDISTRLPEGATLTTFQGVCELEKSGKNKGKPKKSFLIRAVAPVSDDGAVPKEIDGFLTSLRGHPLLQRDFPVVELADIKTAQAVKGQPSNALFTVLCLPKPSAKAPAGKDDDGKKGHK